MKSTFSPEQIVALTQTLSHNPAALAQILGLAPAPAAAPAAAPAPPPPKPQPQPLPEGVHKTTRIPVEPGTGRNLSARPALILAATEGVKESPKGQIVYPRAVCIHFGRSSHVSGIIGSRSSSSAYREDDARRVIENCDAWQLARTLQDQASFWVQVPDEDGSKRPAIPVNAEDWFSALAKSIMLVVTGERHRTAAEQAMLRGLIKDTVTASGPATTTPTVSATSSGPAATPERKTRTRKA